MDDLLREQEDRERALESPSKLNFDEVKHALTASHGFLSMASRRLQCSPGTLKKYIEKYDSLREHLYWIQERVKDLAEFRIMQKINEGDTDMLKFFASRKMADRGYTDRKEIHATNTEIKLNLIDVVQMNNVQRSIEDEAKTIDVEF